VYEAEVAGEVRADDVARWRRGVTLEDGPARPLEVVRLGRGEGTTTRLKLTFTEGRKHEVKRYCEALGHRVVRLRRAAFGPIELGRLRPGQWRALTPREMAQLRATVV
jgi:pseudouridine synthase